MALVAYDYSDESGIETDEEDVKPTAAELAIAAAENAAREAAKTGDDEEEEIFKEIKKEPDSDYPEEKKLDSSIGGVKLGALPSSTQTTSINFDLNILDRNRSQPIRITIPSLKDLEDEEPAKKPKLQKSTKGSTLFSLLPAPKNAASSSSSSLIPQSVCNSKKPLTKPPVKRVVAKPKKVQNMTNVDEDDGNAEPLSSFFFSSNDDPLPPPVDDSEIFKDMPGPSSSEKEPIIEQPLPVDKTVSSYMPTIGPEVPPTVGQPAYSLPSDEGELPLDNDALRKLCGSRDRKRGAQELDIVDVSGSSLVGDSSVILAKELTKEQPAHSFKRKSECSTIQRRKHQITYLAEQAKAQELELRNNWAQNRMTRKQTQAKYGF